MVSKPHPSTTLWVSHHWFPVINKWYDGNHNIMGTFFFVFFGFHSIHLYRLWNRYNLFVFEAFLMMWWHFGCNGHFGQLEVQLQLWSQKLGIIKSAARLTMRMLRLRLDHVSRATIMSMLNVLEGISIHSALKLEDYPTWKTRTVSDHKIPSSLSMLFCWEAYWMHENHAQLRVGS